MKELVVSGKRKSAIAKAKIEEGSGKVLINGKPNNSTNMIRRLMIEEPLIIAKDVLGKLDFNVSVRVAGGGNESQVEASRLAIARAIVAYTKSDKLKKAYLAYDRNILIADVRRKEPYKPGDSKARAKRQKSYR